MVGGLHAAMVKTKLAVFLCPAASGGSDGFVVQRDSGDGKTGVPLNPTIFFAHSHYVTNAGVNQPWGRTRPYCVDYRVAEPIGAMWDVINGPFYRDSTTRPADRQSADASGARLPAPARPPHW